LEARCDMIGWQRPALAPLGAQHAANSRVSDGTRLAVRFAFVIVGWHTL
jgi:hypothetical protein